MWYRGFYVYDHADSGCLIEHETSGDMFTFKDRAEAEAYIDNLYVAFVKII